MCALLLWQQLTPQLPEAVGAQRTDQSRTVKHRHGAVRRRRRGFVDARAQLLGTCAPPADVPLADPRLRGFSADKGEPCARTWAATRSPDNLWAVRGPWPAAAGLGRSQGRGLVCTVAGDLARDSDPPELRSPPRSVQPGAVHPTHDRHRTQSIELSSARHLGDCAEREGLVRLSALTHVVRRFCRSSGGLRDTPGRQACRTNRRASSLTDQLCIPLASTRSVG